MAGHDDLIKVWKPVAEVVHPAQALVRQQRANAAIGNDGLISAGSISLLPAQGATWHLSGAVAVANSQGMRWVPPQRVALERIKAVIGTAPTGAALTFRFRVSGSTVASGSISAGSTSATVAASGEFDGTDVITLDVTQVGSVTAGSNLTVHLIYRPVME